MREIGGQENLVCNDEEHKIKTGRLMTSTTFTTTTKLLFINL